MKILFVALIPCLLGFAKATNSDPPCSSAYPCTECEEKDCTTDADCAGELVCADKHKAGLAALELDPRKAYCTNVDVPSNWELCFDPVIAGLDIDDPPNNDVGDCTEDEPCEECEPTRDCDRDSECAEGLLCPDEWKAELLALGEDGRKANCDANIGRTTSEHCFDPCKIADFPVPEGIDCTQQTVPCVAVIDEWNNAQYVIDADWAAFRTEYPLRPFCLLVPDSGSGYQVLPPTFMSDALTTYAVVNRDYGTVASASDWFTLCGIGTFDVEFVGLFIDNSGSMRTSTVQASYDQFLSDLASAGLLYAVVENGVENWVEPFITTLVPAP